MNICRVIAALAASVICATSAMARDVQHELGTTTVPDAPERIVVLEFSYIDALASVGVSPVGIADDNKRERVIPAYTDAIGDEWVSVGTRKTPSLEVIASLQPDLIIADLNRHAASYDALSEIAPTIVYNSLGGNYHDAIDQMGQIGAAIGKDPEMKARLADHHAKMEALATKVRDRASGLTAHFGVTRTDALSLHSPVSYNGTLLTMLGFDAAMITPDADGIYKTNYVPTTLEELSEINPDILIFGKYTDPAIEDEWANETLYQNMDAVKAGRVFHVTAHNWSRLRGMLAAEMTAADINAILDQIN